MPIPARFRRTASVRLILASLLSLWFVPAASAATCITATVPLSGQSDSSRRPVSLAWTGSELALLKGDGAGNLWIGLHSESLQSIQSDVLVATGWDGKEARILSAGSRLAVFHRDLAGNLRHVSWDPETGETGGAGVLFPGRAITGNRAFDVEWSGEFFAVAESTTSKPNTGVWLNRLDAGGNSVAEAFQFVSISTNAWVDVAITDETIVLAANYEQIPIQGTLVFWTTHEADRFRSGTDAITGINTRLVWRDDAVFAVAVEPGIGPTYELTQAELSPMGVLLAGPEPFLPEANVAVLADLLWNGREILFLWVVQGGTGATQTVRLTRLAPDRSVVTETGFVSDRQRRSFPPTTGLVWTGASAVAGFTRTLAGGTFDSHLASHCPLVAEIEGPTLLLAGTEAIWTARVEGGQMPWSYAWQMGGTSFGSAPSMTRRLSNPGTYVIRLTATDALGAAFVTILELEIVTSLPELEVTAAGPSTLRPGATGSFEALAEGAIGDVQYSWTLGDGRTASGREIDASWAAPGIYTVVLTVTDGAGRSRSAQIEVVVEPVRRRAASRS